MSEPSDMSIQERIARAIETKAAEYSGLVFANGDSARLAAEYLEGLSDAARIARQTSGWIAVEDRLPKPDDLVLVTWTSTQPDWISLAHYDQGRWWDERGVQAEEGITYWQTLPGLPLPKGDDAS